MKNLKLKTMKKFKEEINFTETQNKEYYHNYKGLQMDSLEPARVIVERENHNMDD